MAFSFFKKKRITNFYTIAFYNLENLFDTRDDPTKLDDDFTPKGFKKWTPKRYRRKINKLSRTLSHLGVKESNRPPVLIGLAELENKQVIADLITARALKDIGYDYVHYDSPDERGIDTALLYNPQYFKLLSSNNIPLLVNNLDGAAGCHQGYPLRARPAQWGRGTSFCKPLAITQRRRYGDGLQKN